MAQTLSSTSQFDASRYEYTEDNVFVETDFDVCDQEIVQYDPNNGVHTNPTPRVRQRNNQRQQPSPRSARANQSFNFCIYGATLFIPGIAMLIVYFFLFNTSKTGDRWSPADAFVITGAILVGFSMVAIIIGIWQYCLSRFESSGISAQTADERRTYSDHPPCYARFKKISKPSTSTKSEPPPSFESCSKESKFLPGISNIAYEISEDSEMEPPSYPCSLYQSENNDDQENNYDFSQSLSSARTTTA